tara:strand:- start:14143 stop:17292 length:3150 start_codon:yes stop_codon:yes gene_type:complete
MTDLESSFSNNESKNLIFDLAPFPMWIYELESYAFMAVNQEAIRQYGYSESDFLRMNLKDIRPTEDIPILEKAIADTRERKDRFKGDGLFRHQKKDGKIIYVHIKSNLITYKGKKAEIVTAIDLTERYERERQIEDQKRILATIGIINQIFLKSDNWVKALQQSLEMLVDYLLVQRICFFEESKLYSNNHDANIGWGTYGGTEPIPGFREFQLDLYEEFPHYKQSILSGESIEIINSQLPSSRSKNFLVNQQIISLLEIPLMSDERLIGLITIEDAKNERKWQEGETQILLALTSNLAQMIIKAEMQQQLVQSEARFRTLVQNGSDLIAIIDSCGIYKYVAPTSFKVLGIPAEEFIGKNAFEYIHKDDIPRLRNDLELIDKEDKVSIAPYRFLDSHKNWRWIQTDLINRTCDPIIAGIVANTREVTHEVEKLLTAELLAKLTTAISRHGPLAACLDEAMREISNRCEFDIAEIWLVSEDSSRLDLISKSGQRKVLDKFYTDTMHVHSLEKGRGLPGMVWQLQETQFLPDLGKNKAFQRAEAAHKAGIHTAVGIPLMYNNVFIGCIVCLSQHEKIEILPQVKLLIELGVHIAVVIKQKITEEHYHNFFNISPDPHGLLGFDGYLKKVNDAFANILGYSKTVLLSKPVFDFLLKEDKKQSRKRFNEILLDTPTASFEARFVTSKGEIKWLVVRGTVIMESKIIVAVAKDITEQKEAEIKLSNSNERLKRAQKIAKLGYWVRDFSNEISEWSEEVYSIYGYTPDNFIPSIGNVLSSLHPEDRHLMESNPITLLEPGIVKSFEHRIITALNEIKWVHQEIRILADKNKIPFRIEGTIQDITERKESESQLAISNERFKLATQASNEMIWEVDHQKQTIYRGAGYRKLVNYFTNEPFSIDNSWYGKITSSDRQKVWESMQFAMADKNQDVWSSEYKIITKDGSIAYFVDRCFILRDSSGNPVRSIGSALDVTKSRQQLLRIKKQNEKLKNIAWTQSHIVRAPLARMLGIMEMIEDNDVDSQDTFTWLKYLRDSANELDEIIKEMIDKAQDLTYR